jgi:hypothetical protein
MLRTISWILLTILGALTLFVSLASARVAYLAPAEEQILPNTSLADAGMSPEVATAVRARRGTAAAYAAGFAVLFLIVVTVPYRRGEVWSYWAVLAALVTITAVSALRWPTLHVKAGADAAAMQLAVGAVALLLDVKRLRPAPPYAR